MLLIGKMSYQFNHPVKYYEIYSDLMEKVANRTMNEAVDANEEYTAEDVNNICLVIYQEELLEICGAQTMTKIGEKLEELWDTIIKSSLSSHTQFIELVKQYQRAFFAPFNKFTDNTVCRMYFGVLFDFNLFYITHRCLKCIGEQREIPNNLLNEFNEKLTNVLNERIEKNKNEKCMTCNVYQAYG